MHQEKKNLVSIIFLFSDPSFRIWQKNKWFYISSNDIKKLSWSKHV